MWVTFERRDSWIWITCEIEHVSLVVTSQREMPAFVPRCSFFPRSCRVPRSSLIRAAFGPRLSRSLSHYLSLFPHSGRVRAAFMPSRRRHGPYSARTRPERGHFSLCKTTKNSPKIPRLLHTTTVCPRAGPLVLCG